MPSSKSARALAECVVTCISVLDCAAHASARKTSSKSTAKVRKQVWDISAISSWGPFNPTTCSTTSDSFMATWKDFQQPVKPIFFRLFSARVTLPSARQARLGDRLAMTLSIHTNYHSRANSVGSDLTAELGKWVFRNGTTTTACSIKGSLYLVNFCVTRRVACLSPAF